MAGEEDPSWPWIGSVAGYQYSFFLGFYLFKGFVLDGQPEAATAALHLRLVFALPKG